MALNLIAYPLPAKAKLYKNGVFVTDSRQGTIFIGLYRMGIQTVDSTAYEGHYTIQSTNEAGTGDISFRLKVKGNE